MTRAAWLGPLRAAGVVLALGFLGFAARSAWQELGGARVAFHAGTALSALAMLVVTYFGMVALWRRLLADLGAPTRYPETLQLWSFSNLGRYLPGKIWQMVGLVAFARDLGVTPGLAAAAAVIALALMICTGALTGLLLAPGAVAGMGSAAVGVAAAAAALAAPVIRPGLVNGLLRRLPRALGCSEVPPLRRTAVVRLVLLFCLAWIAHGASFAVFASAFGTVTWTGAPGFAGVFSLAYVVGLLAVFAPGGIGVREGVLGWLLSGVTTGDLPVHVVAVASRLWAMAGEVVVLGAALAVRLASRRRAT